MTTNYLTLTRRERRKQGYAYLETVEYFARGRRHDLFGFVDIIAIPQDLSEPWLFIQVTSWANTGARKRKILSEDVGGGQYAVPMAFLAAAILSAGHRLLIEGWRKNKRGRWEFKEIEITPDDLP